MHAEEETPDVSLRRSAATAPISSSPIVEIGSLRSQHSAVVLWSPHNVEHKEALQRIMSNTNLSYLGRATSVLPTAAKDAETLSTVRKRQAEVLDEEDHPGQNTPGNLLSGASIVVNMYLLKTERGVLTMKKSAIVVAVTILGLGAVSIRADIILNDGGMHNIDYRLGGPSGYEQLDIYDGPIPTTVNFLEGGSAVDVRVNDSSRFNMYDGYIQDGLFADDSSLVNVYGGKVNQAFWLTGFGLANVYGGTISELLFTYDNSICNIYGGAINADIFVRDSSILNIYGSGFMLDGSPVDYGPLAPLTDTCILTGTLRMGDSLSYTDLRAFPDTATINLIETQIVPLPGAVLLGMIGLSIAAVKLRKCA